MKRENSQSSSSSSISAAEPNQRSSNPPQLGLDLPQRSVSPNNKNKRLSVAKIRSIGALLSLGRGNNNSSGRGGSPASGNSPGTVSSSLPIGSQSAFLGASMNGGLMGGVGGSGGITRFTSSHAQHKATRAAAASISGRDHLQGSTAGTFMMGSSMMGGTLTRSGGLTLIKSGGAAHPHATFDATLTHASPTRDEDNAANTTPQQQGNQNAQPTSGLGQSSNVGTTWRNLSSFGHLTHRDLPHHQQQPPTPVTQQQMEASAVMRRSPVQPGAAATPHHASAFNSTSGGRQRAVSLVASAQSPLAVKGAGDFDSAWPGGGVGLMPPMRERRSSLQPHQYPPHGIDYNAATSSSTTNTNSMSGPLSPLVGRTRYQPRGSQEGAKKQSISGFSSTSQTSPLSGYSGHHQPSLSVVESGSKTRGDRRMSTKSNNSGEGIQFGDVTISYQEMASLKRIFETFDEDHSNSIDSNELKQALAAAGHALTDEQIDELFDEVRETPKNTPDGGAKIEKVSAGDGGGDGESGSLIRSASSSITSTRKSTEESLTLHQFVQLLSLWKEACQYKMFEGSSGSSTVQDQRIGQSLKTRLLLHDGKYRVLWDALIYCVTFYVWCWTTFFLTRPPDEVYDFATALIGLDVFVSICMAADIVIQFLSTRKGPEGILDDYKSVGKQYARTWLVPDIIAVLPFHQFSTSTAKDDPNYDTMSRIVLAFSLFRLVKMIKMPTLFQRSGRRHLTPFHLTMSVNFIPIFKKMYAFLVSVHFVSVMWSLLKQYVPRDVSSTSVGDDNPDYTTSVYYVMATLSTCGFGDTSIDGPLEQVFAIVLCLAAMVLNGIVIGFVVENMRQSDIYTERADKLRETLGVCQYFQIPTSLLNEILSFQNHVLEHNLGAAYTDLIRGLPQDMRSNIGLFIRVSLISHVSFFKDAHQGAKVAIAQRLTPVIYLPEQYVFIAGEVGDSMYFISHGFVDVVTTDGTLVRSLKSGDHVGEAALLEYQNIRRVSVKALTYCDLFRLACSDFMLVLVRFPKVRRRMADEATQIFEGTGGMTSEVEIVRDEQKPRRSSNIINGIHPNDSNDEDITRQKSNSLGGFGGGDGRSRSSSMGVGPVRRVQSTTHTIGSSSNQGISPLRPSISSFPNANNNVSSRTPSAVHSSSKSMHQPPRSPTSPTRVSPTERRSGGGGPQQENLPGQVADDRNYSPTISTARVVSSFSLPHQSSDQHLSLATNQNIKRRSGGESGNVNVGRHSSAMSSSPEEFEDGRATSQSPNSQTSTRNTPLTTTIPDTGKVLSHLSSGVHPMLRTSYGQLGDVFTTGTPIASKSTSSSKMQASNSNSSSLPSGRIFGSNRVLVGGSGGSGSSGGGGSGAAGYPSMVVNSVSASLPAHEQLEYCKSLVRGMRVALRRDSSPPHEQ